LIVVFLVVTILLTSANQVESYHLNQVRDRVYVLGYPSSYEFLTGALQQQGFQAAVGLSLAQEDLGKYNVIFVVSRGLYGYSPSKMWQYVRDGGGLLLTTGDDDIDSVNRISVFWGISYTSTVGMRDPPNGAIDSQGNWVGHKISNFDNHPITQGISSIAVVAGSDSGCPPCAPVMVVKAGQIIARFSSKAYSTDGTYATGQSPPAVVAFEYGRGRVVAVSSAAEGNWAYPPKPIDVPFGMLDTLRFYLNAVQWLSAPGYLAGSGTPTTTGVSTAATATSSPSTTSAQEIGQQTVFPSLLVLAIVIVLVAAVVVGIAATRKSRVRSKGSISARYCTECGAKNLVTSSFCGRCGHKME
jgi:hypothetical protein